MALATTTRNTVPDWLVSGTVYVQLHTGAPNLAGTSNVASNNVRKAVTFAAAVNGVKTSTSAAQWTAVPATETYSHITLWSAASGGTCLLRGDMTSFAATAGQNFEFPIGGLTVTGVH